MEIKSRRGCRATGGSCGKASSLIPSPSIIRWSNRNTSSGEFKCILLYLWHGELIWLSLHLVLIGLLMGNVSLEDDNSGQWYESTRETVNVGSQWDGNAADSHKSGDICVTRLFLFKTVSCPFMPVAITFSLTANAKNHLFKENSFSWFGQASHSLRWIPAKEPWLVFIFTGAWWRADVIQARD